MTKQQQKDEARRILISVRRPAYEACHKLLDQLAEIHNEKVAQATDAFKVLSDLALEAYKKNVKK